MAEPLADGGKRVKQSRLETCAFWPHHAPMKHTFFSAIAAIALLTGCQAESAPRKPAAQAAKPAMWKLADKDTTVYLFGTIHVLPKDLQWRTPLMNAAIAQSSDLVLEVGNIDDQAAVSGAFMKLAITPNLPPLAKRIPAEKVAGLNKLIKEAGLPAQVLDTLETWAAGLTIASASLAKLDVDPDSGADRALSAVFKAAKKPVTGFETGEEQLGFFDTLPESEQRTFLIGMVDEQTDAKVEFAKMIAAWKRGDEKEIALSFDDEAKLSKSLTEVLLYKRNANWTEKLAERMKKPGTIMVAVGAGHLAGDRSVVDMLRKRGFSVKRVQ
jgi:uncharacterized protein